MITAHFCVSRSGGGDVRKASGNTCFKRTPCGPNFSKRSRKRNAFESTNHASDAVWVCISRGGANSGPGRGIILCSANCLENKMILIRLGHGVKPEPENSMPV